jgi:hypothetical protein
MREAKTEPFSLYSKNKERFFCGNFTDHLLHQREKKDGIPLF